MSLPPSDKQAALKRMRLIATGLLVLMAGIFVVARYHEDTYPSLGWIRAFAEAAMVGALADWFAVVALFKRPFGIPLPHTNVIANNKRRISGTLAVFVVENFLSREVVGRHLDNLDLASAAVKWATENKREISGKAAQLMPHVLDATDDGGARQFAMGHVIAAFKGIPVAPLAGQLLSTLTENNRHQVMLTSILDLAGPFIEENRQHLREIVREKMPLPEIPGLATFNEKAADWIVNAGVALVHAELANVARDNEHPLRRRFEAKLRVFIEELRTSPEFRVKGEQLKEQLLRHDALQTYIGEIWSGLKARILEDIARPDSEMRHRLEQAIERMATTIKDEAELRARLNSELKLGLLELLDAHRSEIRQLIEGTVQGWDGVQVSSKLELEIGRDLQWIRINGSIVGGLVGLALHFLDTRVFS